MKNVRVRFAPSPTGGLHIGGVRTALFNYLFAKKHNGTFILRIEDTDQTRYVEGAEEYIREALEWCGLVPDESTFTGGKHAPYRQSDRKEIYGQYAEQLVAKGHAYYAFDTPQELEEMKERLKLAGLTNPQYDAGVRLTMKNSLSMPADEVASRLKAGEPYVIRAKIPPKDEIRFEDLIRGWVLVHGTTLDDKVLMKSDGMPTYHLANVVDDHLMEISHVIRGEEWLPSTPLHILLYRFFGWEDTMPQFAHLPLILKPDGNGKLSKRAADQAGFPIFPLSWQVPGEPAASVGFREMGFLPEALVNFLAFLGWNPGTEQEIFSMDQLIDAFSIEKINKAGTKFDIEKAKWFNQQYLKSADVSRMATRIQQDLKTNFGISCSPEFAAQIFDLLKERVTYPTEFAGLSLYLFDHPKSYDTALISKKWDEEARQALKLSAEVVQSRESITPDEARDLLFSSLEAKGLKPGKNMQALRLALTGEGSGPDLMTIISILGGKRTAERIHYSLSSFAG